MFTIGQNLLENKKKRYLGKEEIVPADIFVLEHKLNAKQQCHYKNRVRNRTHILCWYIYFEKWKSDDENRYTPGLTPSPLIQFKLFKLS